MVWKLQSTPGLWQTPLGSSFRHQAPKRAPEPWQGDCPKCRSSRSREYCILTTVRSHFHETVPVFDALIFWLSFFCQGQNLGLNFQGRTKQFCFLGKWEVWDGERSLWRGDDHSW